VISTNLMRKLNKDQGEIIGSIKRGDEHGIVDKMRAIIAENGVTRLLASPRVVFDVG
jgi:hypothetical protein